MEVRHASANEIPDIVNLLKLSLGESLMPKSVEFWKWKHIDNPFGTSPVLVALENNELVGVRAFMRWQWQQENRIYKAVRAVDTATHPEHQGKGIFRRLTLQLVEECKTEGIDFIFNTPNKLSAPGYLKMGWISLGKLPLQFNLKWFKKRIKISDLSDNWNEVHDHPAFVKHKRAGLATNISPGYLLWRYQYNPNVKYQLLSSREVPFILVYRIKKGKRFTEVRITDFIGKTELEHEAIAALKSSLTGVKVITKSGCGQQTSIDKGFIRAGLGPLVTARDLNLVDFQKKITFEHWNPSLGDLELF